MIAKRLLLPLLLSLATTTLAAEPAAEAGARKAEAPREAAAGAREWMPPAVDYDWLQLTSREWLKGDIKAMYNKSLEFDSDKLKLLTIKWKDVRVLRAHQISSVNIEGMGTVTGILEVTGDKVWVRSKEGVLHFDRSRLISFAPGGEREKDLWAVKLTLSLNLKEGNNRQIDYAARLNVKRRSAATRFLLDYGGNVSRTNVSGGSVLTETLNNHRLTSSFDYYRNRHFFFNPVMVEFFTDPFLNIDLRSTIGAGVGYTVIDDGSTELSFSGGPSYIKTRFVSVEAGKASDEVTAALVVRTLYDTELTDRLDFIAKYNIQYGSEASGGYTHYAIATLQNELTDDLDIDISLEWDYVSRPVTGEGGITPKSNDYRMMLGISYSY